MTTFFTMFPAAEQRRIRGLMSRHRFERDEVVFRQGDPGAGLHVIEAGWFLAQAHTSTGGRVGMAIEGPGDVFGELALLNQLGRRTATIRALTAGETMSLDAERFNECRRTLPEMDRFLIGLLTARVERLTVQLAEAAWAPADRRVCREVLRLVTVFGDGPIRLKQEELASLAHTTRPTVSTVLSALARDGIVVTGRGRLRILDLGALQRRAEPDERG